MQDVSAKLKSLKTQTSKIEQERSEITAEIANLSNRRNNLGQRLQNLNAEIQKLKSSQSTKVLVVSEHALLRFLERVRGMNLQELKAEILPESSSAIDTLGSGRFPVGNPPTHYLVIRDKVVVTIEAP